MTFPDVGPSDSLVNSVYFYILFQQNTYRQACLSFVFVSESPTCALYPFLIILFVYFFFVGAFNILWLILFFWLAANNFSSFFGCIFSYTFRGYSCVHKPHIVKMFNFVSFEIGINQWSHHHNQINMHFYHPSKSFWTSLVTQIVKKVNTKVKVAQSCMTLWDFMNYTVHGILRARILEWVPVPFSRVSSQPGDQTHVSLIAGGFFTSWATGEATREDSKESACNARDLGLIPGSRRFPWRREWQPTSVFLPGEFHGQRSLVGYSPWG